MKWLQFKSAVLKTFTYNTFFAIGCITTLVLFTVSFIAVIRPYTEVFKIQYIVVTPEIIQPGQQIDIHSTYTITETIPTIISASWVCESGSPLTTIQKLPHTFTKGTYVDIKTSLIAPSRIVTEKCKLQYDITLKPNVIRSVPLTFYSNEVTLLGVEK